MVSVIHLHFIESQNSMSFREKREKLPGPNRKICILLFTDNSEYDKLWEGRSLSRPSGRRKFNIDSFVFHKVLGKGSFGKVGNWQGMIFFTCINDCQTAGCMLLECLIWCGRERESDPCDSSGHQQSGTKTQGSRCLGPLVAVRKGVIPLPPHPHLQLWLYCGF